MYYKRNSFEISVPVSDLAPGVRVCVPVAVTYGWGGTVELTRYDQYTIRRVTPKKTKVVCEDGTTFVVKNTEFLMPVKEMDIENERVSLFLKMRKIINDFSYIPRSSYISSYEKMREAANHLNAFYEYLLENSKFRKDY